MNEVFGQRNMGSEKAGYKMITVTMLPKRKSCVAALKWADAEINFSQNYVSKKWFSNFRV